MPGDGLKLTVYMGERERAGGRLLADVLLDIFERHGVRSSALFRGIEGFGLKHRLQTERLLTLSEDLPLLAVAIDERGRIEALRDEVAEATGHGLITLERVRLLSADGGEIELPPGPDELKLTVFTGRRERVAARPAHVAVVDLLHRHGVAGASVLLGLDGTAHGTRRRGRFLAGNAQVPMMILSVGGRESIARVLPELRAMGSEQLLTLERVRVCKRDGVLLADPGEAPTPDAGGLAYWQKLIVYAGEQVHHEGRPLHAALVRRLRSEGAAGATALRGQWGYHGDHRPHGERFWSLRRHVPVLTVLLDTPANALRSFEVVDELTGGGGLVTSELVPALRASGPAIEHGGLELAPARAPWER